MQSVIYIILVFTVVYCESVNLIGYITVFYLPIENSCTGDCARDPISACISTHRAPRLNRNVIKQFFSYPLLDIFFLFAMRLR